MSIDLKYFGGIRDSIHGLILLTKVESEIINTKFMDRLRYIRNSALAYRVYPSHTVTRFTHSLGVMHIAGQMARVAIQRYLRLVKDKNFWKEEISEDYSVVDVLQIIRLAALLHDIGHGPFSHSSEPILKEILSKYYKSEEGEMREKGIDAVHEYYSFKIITGKTEIKEILEDHGIDPIDVAKLISKDNNDKKAGGLKTPGLQLVRRIISSQIDADRLDNLLRDSHGVGVPYGLVDIDNIINNIYIYRKENNLDLAFHIRALDSIEHMLDSRYKMYIWIYLHRVNVLYDAILMDTLNKMIEDGELEKSLLHWKNLAREWGDYTDDKFILHLISKALLSNKSRYWLSSSMFNQNALPIPIWRNFEDLLALMDWTIDEGSRMLNSMVNSYIEDKLGFQNTIAKHLKRKISEDIDVIIGFKEMPPAYKWEENDVKILTGPNVYRNLRDISMYIRMLYEMGRIYKPFYIYYYVKGKRRNTYSKLYRRIRETLKQILRDRLPASEGRKSSL